MTAANEHPPAAPWEVFFTNSRVRNGWNELWEKAPESMARCQEHLENRPLQRVPGRVFPLKGKKYKGVWEYEVTGGDRVFYQPDGVKRTVLVYYAGKHIEPAPTP